MLKKWINILDCDVFGCHKGAVLVWRGFADAASQEIFDTVLRLLKPNGKWSLLERDNILTNSTWFSLYEWFKFINVAIIQTLCVNQISSLNLKTIEPKKK